MAGNIIFNVIALGASGLVSLPSILASFKPPLADRITIDLGIGATNSLFRNFSDGVNGPKGNVPFVTLYDVNGNEIGRNADSGYVDDGGAFEVIIAGTAGSTASEIPVYIQLQAAGSDEICIAFFSTSSSAAAGGDFRSWNGATAAFCNVPWYPSAAQFPTESTTYRPPCFWMSNDGRFVDAFTARLFDFFFPESSLAESTVEQWTNHPETLCNAPARQQFYNNTGECIPFYPSGLDLEKNTLGFDADFGAVQSSFTMQCSAAGIPFNCEADLVLNGPPDAPCSATIDTNPSVTLPASITSQLQSDITLALGGGQVIETSPPATADGVGNFGGAVGQISKSEAGQQLSQPPPVQTADGVGNFGGDLGEIPKSEAGQDFVTSTQATVQATEQAAQSSTQASIEGDEGAVIVSINLGGQNGQWEAVSTTLAAGAKAKARRREADRAAILRQREDPDTTPQPAVTPAPKYNPREKGQQKSSQNAAPSPKRDRHLPVHERSIEKRAWEPHNWCQESQLVVSEHDGHSAVQVCESESSWGPDFVSIVEGVYCDMCNRQRYPLCDGKKTSTPCFDLERRQLSGPARWWRRDDRVGPIKRYDSVRHWK